LTVREGARLQSFPDWFAFQGSEASCYKQIGNAVPPLLAYAIAGSFRNYLDSTLRLDTASIKSRRQPAQMQLLNPRPHERTIATWVTDAPEHLIHFNRGKFLGPLRPMSFPSRT
jgi:hypothetical protein